MHSNKSIGVQKAIDGIACSANFQAQEIYTDWSKHQVLVM